MPVPAAHKSAKIAPPAAAPRRVARQRPPANTARRSPNYATREETLKIAERVMDEDAEVFRRLADA